MSSCRQDCVLGWSWIRSRSSHWIYVFRPPLVPPDEGQDLITYVNSARRTANGSTANFHLIYNNVFCSKLKQVLWEFILCQERYVPEDYSYFGLERTMLDSLFGVNFSVNLHQHFHKDLLEDIVNFRNASNIRLFHHPLSSFQFIYVMDTDLLSVWDNLRRSSHKRPERIEYPCLIIHKYQYINHCLLIHMAFLCV